MTGCVFIGIVNYFYPSHLDHPMVFAEVEEFNKLLYSRFAGEISMVGPVYSQHGERYRKRVVIYPKLRQEHNCAKVGALLSKFGTVTAHNNHSETYYVFEQDVPIPEVVAACEGLKPYDERQLIRARVMFP